MNNAEAFANLWHDGIFTIIEDSKYIKTIVMIRMQMSLRNEVGTAEDKLQTQSIWFHHQSHMGQPVGKKQEIKQHYKAKKFNLWTSLEHVFTLTVSTLPFTSSFKSEAVSCEMDGLSVARFPKANRVWLLLYLRSKNKRAISTCRTVGVEALIWTRKRE